MAIAEIASKRKQKGSFARHNCDSTGINVGISGKRRREGAQATLIYPRQLVPVRLSETRTEAAANLDAEQRCAPVSAGSRIGLSGDGMLNPMVGSWRRDRPTERVSEEVDAPNARQ